MARNHAIEILESDHARVRTLLAELTRQKGADVEEQADTLMQLIAAVDIHTSLEEEIFYQAYREAVAGTPEEQLCFEYLEKHDLVDIVMSNIQDDEPGGIEFAARAKVLREVLEGHLAEEEQVLFPRARELFTVQDLEQLGIRLVDRRDQLLSAENEGRDEEEILDQDQLYQEEEDEDDDEEDNDDEYEEDAGDEGRQSDAALSRRVDLNTADRSALQTIEGIDHVRAERLLAYRESHGPFRDWSEIDDVPGFDAILIQKLRQGATLGTKQS